jgi:hypothetical protein
MALAPRSRVISIVLAIGLVSAVGCSKKGGGSDRPDAPAEGTQMTVDGLVGKVVAGSNVSFQYSITSKSRHGYALATSTGESLGKLSPEMGQLFDVSYESGTVKMAGKEIPIPEGATVVLIKGTGTSE